MNSSSGRSGMDRGALLAASVTVVLWASAFVSIRASADYFEPGALALGRLLTGSLALVCLLLAKGGGVPPRKAWPGIVGSGVLWFGVYMVVLNWGEQLVDAGTASMVVNVGPMVVALLGGWFLKEGFPPLLLAGMAVSFVGAVVVGFSSSGGGSSSVLGLGLCLLAAVAYGAGVVLQKPALRHATPIQVTTYGCLIGAVACLPFSGQLVSDLSRAPVSATLNVVYLGLFPTALAFTTWAYALSRTTAGKMGATTYAVPAVVILISWLALDEVPGWVTLLGGAICLGGVAVSRMPGFRRRGPEETAEPAASVETAR
ncbi:DMT family transporter [Streptomyces sp. ISL-44]|uniref:DMT family transporter n=1 Tax=unclassified Streptomyces TaxID=2593676 RepID=UPI001BE8480F|nr:MULTISPECIES: DMT family transporter [unclassified Streptomyces]MBT2541451.1 DMT family transporter [Streptomyces sp. ISL-44]MCX5611667.1 DMT family transporter [Streptomyces sp. NBC_00047]UUU39501.1 DMT family transporter [Streptomyces sp. NBC_00162]